MTPKDQRTVRRLITAAQVILSDLKSPTLLDLNEFGAAINATERLLSTPLLAWCRPGPDTLRTEYGGHGYAIMRAYGEYRVRLDGVPHANTRTLREAKAYCERLAVNCEQ